MTIKCQVCRNEFIPIHPMHRSFCTNRCKNAFEADWGDIHDKIESLLIKFNLIKSRMTAYWVKLF